MAGSCGAFCSFCGRCGRQIAQELRAKKPHGVAPPGVTEAVASFEGHEEEASELSQNCSDRLSPGEGGLHER